MSEIRLLYWIRTDRGTYVAHASVRQFFTIKYVISCDEDDTWQGTFEQRWREVGREDDQYVYLGLEDCGIRGRHALEQLIPKIEAFHREQAWPALCDLTSQYIRDNAETDGGEDGH